MRDAQTGQIFRTITGRILNPGWLAANSYDGELLAAYLQAPEFFRGLQGLIRDKDFSCRRFLQLTRPLLEAVAEESLGEKWLADVYRFCLEKALPRTDSTPFPDQMAKTCVLFLEMLRIICEYQRMMPDGTWQSLYPMNFLSQEEERDLESPQEYRLFQNGFNDDYIYEMMKLGQEITGFNTLDHICAVHFLALAVGRQLAKAGLPIDLGRVSGAAAGHDVGKFFCRGKEMSRVPYLHYYYTDLWFKKHNIVYIKHIALNHSTWDLELDNLSLESLVLIYADFCVKNRDNQMHIYSLTESFSVILEKLDNVDAAKETRYRRVYAKLKDFEDYMRFLGINLDPLGEPLSEPLIKVNFALLQGQAISDNIKYLAINHNIHLMHQLRDEFSSNAILELARSETDWRNFRTYLRIFEEYSTYLTQKQKLNTLKFLYEQLVHSEYDIRRYCAEIIGILIALFDEDYRKEVPEGSSLEQPELTGFQLFHRYLGLFIAPDHKIIPEHRRWIAFQLDNMVASLFRHCREKQKKGYLAVLLEYYRLDTLQSRDVVIGLLETAVYVPVAFGEENLLPLFDFIAVISEHPDIEQRLLALDAARRLLPSLPAGNGLARRLFVRLVQSPTCSMNPLENYLNHKIARLLDLEEATVEQYESYCQQDQIKVPEMFLSNLKTATPYIMKYIQVEILTENAEANPREVGLHTAMHFCNVLKVSTAENVRRQAGKALVRIVPTLPLGQRNDVVLELARALDVRGFQFTEIPGYLGQVIKSLQPRELDEVLDDFVEQIKQSNPQLTALYLKAVGEALANYQAYGDSFAEEAQQSNERFLRMLGILLNGLGNYHSQIRQMALAVIGKQIFGSETMRSEDKTRIYQLIAKKVLTLLDDNKKDMLSFMTNAAALNYIYKFVFETVFVGGPIELPCFQRVAFFPGAFDPFSLSHKEIATTIRDMGFEVYLQVDEFSWSKQTLPHLLREEIIEMSVADELGIFLYPEEFPTNIVNGLDLAELKRNFPHSQVYMVTGSDVVLNASAYQGGGDKPILSFAHIIFDRKNVIVPDENEQGMEEVVQRIKGDTIRLTLPPQYEDISSTQIRDSIDENRDISRLVDPLAQQYIYDNGFYRREPQYKTLIKTISLNIEAVQGCSPALAQEIFQFPGVGEEGVWDRLHPLLERNSSALVLVRDARQGRLVGFSLFYPLRTGDVFFEFNNSKIAEYIRENAVGAIASLRGLMVDRNAPFENLAEIVLNETLTYAMEQEFHYAVFNNIIQEGVDVRTREMLRLHGFQELPYGDERNPVLVVNMNAPCSLTFNLGDMIKEPMRSSVNIRSALTRTRHRLQKAIAQLYPGNLVVTFDNNMVHEALVRMICQENGVPTVPTIPRQLGPAMCVPYGNLLNRYIVPNTVTKALNIERYFAPDAKSFQINQFPHYLSLENQIKMLRSFKRPMILVDDLVHKGYRMKVLDPLLNRERITVQKIVVGILSGRGKALMDGQGRQVEGAYFIPRLKVWFNEDILYPFIGGDTLWRGIKPPRNMIPSINLILPYTFPTYIRNASPGAIYDFSRVCIENARDILSTLESEYLAIHGRTLTMAILGEALVSPRCPDQGRNMAYDLNVSPSSYLENDLEALGRTEEYIKASERR